LNRGLVILVHTDQYGRKAQWPNKAPRCEETISLPIQLAGENVQQVHQDLRNWISETMKLSDKHQRVLDHADDFLGDLGEYPDLAGTFSGSFQRWTVRREPIGTSVFIGCAL